MSTNAIETILSRAMTEPAFAEQLFANPDQALAGLDLTADELTKFKNMTRAEFEFITSENRKSFGIGVPQKSGWDNHNESALKVRKGLTIDHNETVLKVCHGLGSNHNETTLDLSKSIEVVFVRAMSDATFADELFTDPDQALAGFNLTAEEIEKFKGMSRAEFEVLASEERKSFGIGVPQKSGWENHNETALKVRKGLGANHNETVSKIQK